MIIFSSIHSLLSKYRLNQRIKRIDMRSQSRVSGLKLTSSQRKQVNDFWDRYTSVRLNAHTFYFEKTGYFSPYYIPDSIHIYRIDPYFNDWGKAKHIDNKCYYRRIFPDCLMPKTIVYRINGFWYNGDYKLINESQALLFIMENRECFIKKAIDSYGGKGVFYFNSMTQTIDYLKGILSDLTSDIVVQEAIVQSPTMSQLNESSVNTVRLISLLGNDGIVKIYSTIVRMGGVKGIKVDNATSGGITCGVTENGQLKNIAYNAKGDKFMEHPSSKIHFETIRIPNFDKVKEMVVKAHLQVPHFRLVSWDIAIDLYDNPILIEANLCDGEIDFHQLNNGPLFNKDTEIILKEIFGK